MAAVTIYAQANGNWDAANNWNTAANGSGTAYTNPQNGTDQFTCLLNGKTITLNVTVSVTQIDAANTAGKLAVPNSSAATVTVAKSGNGCNSSYPATILAWGTGTCSLTINGDVQYASTFAGMLSCGTGQTITVNGKVNNTSSGSACACTGSGVLTISNSGGTAVELTSTGRVVNHSSTGNVTIVGNVNNSSSGRAITLNTTCTCTITGDVTQSGTNGYCLYNTVSGPTITITGNVSASNGFAVFASAGSITINGELSNSNSGWALYITGGSHNWLGARTIAAGIDCAILIGGGTLFLATVSSALTLTCSGRFVIVKQGGTLTLAAGGYTASFIRQIAAAQIAIIGMDASSYISGPTLPAAADVESGVSYGYAGDPQTGTLVGGSGGGEHAYVFSA